MNFYIYAYFNPLKSSTLHECGHEPFYVGKGKGDRMYDHLIVAKNHKINSHKYNTIRKILQDGANPQIILLKTDLTETEAFNLEKEYIALWGRRDLETGPLTNKTSGGEGASGFMYTPEHREKMSNYAKNRTTEHRKKISENMRNRSPEHRQKLIDAQKERYKNKENTSMYGKRHSDESKAKMSASVKAALAKIEKRTGDKHHNSKAIILHGVHYPSIAAAHKATGLHRYTIKKYSTSVV